MSDQPVSVPKVPDAPGWWWRDSSGEPEPVYVTPHDGALRYMFVGGSSTPILRVTDDGLWLATVLTPAEAAALTQRAERAEAERDEARRWAEDAAAAENASAADLRHAKATIADLRGLLGGACRERDELRRHLARLTAVIQTTHAILGSKP